MTDSADETSVISASSNDSYLTISSGDESVANIDDKPSSNDGCKHYVRRCLFVSPCCEKIFPCRVCHDEEVTTHTIDRHSVKEILCSSCKTKQEVSNRYDYET